MIDYRIDRRATVARGITLAAFVVISEYAVIETGVRFGPAAYVGPGVRIGEGADIGPHAVILADVPAGATIAAGEVWRGVLPVAEIAADLAKKRETYRKVK